MNKLHRSPGPRRSIWVFSGVALLVVGFLLPHAFSAPITPYVPDFDWKTAWNGLEITFKTDGPKGAQIWRYLHGDSGQWRLELVESNRGRMTSIFDGKAQYYYDPVADFLSETPVPTSRSYEVEAGYLLRPSLAILVGNPDRWEVVGQSTMKGFRVVEVASKDGSERLWIDPEHGLPVKWTADSRTWELLTAKFGQQHGAEQFTPPQAKHVKKLSGVPNP